MQYFANNGVLLIGKYKGKLFLDLPKQYTQWAKTNLPGYKDQLKTIAKLVSKQPNESTSQWLSTNGNSKIANKGLRKPNNKRFTSRAIRAVNY
jgi:uncharacterized protein (DUF3820 family)